MSALAVNLPECPVCLETMTAPIFLCQSGHSLCKTCTTSLLPPVCPICRQAMTHMRNWQLEEMTRQGPTVKKNKFALQAKVPCPNKASGCMYTMTLYSAAHAKECIYRDMVCPLGAVMGRCSWQGKLIGMMSHFKECHAEYCDVNPEEDVVLRNVSVKVDHRHFFLVAQGNLIFIITMKIDTLQKMAYWTIQHIGSKNGAKQYIYEIHVASNQDAMRKVVFIDHCFNDVIKADEVFRSGKCAVLPLDVLAHFIMDKMLTFRFFIKKIPPASLKGMGNDGNNDNTSNQGTEGPKGPGLGPKPNRRNGPLNS